MQIETRRSSRLIAAYPTLPFDTVLAQGVDVPLLAEATDSAALAVTEQLQAGLNEPVSKVVGQFERFFESAGHRYPLSNQIRSAAKKGFPPVPPQVRSLLVAEAATGVLMGVQDGSKIQSYVELDLLAEPESFEGMRQRVKCDAGEIIVRDGTAIVASLFQGPDKRTAVGAESTCLLYYIFGTPDAPDSTASASTWIYDLLLLCSDRVDHATSSGAGGSSGP